MTLDEAILHAEEVAADCEAYENQDAIETRSYPSRRKCAAEHRQLAAWLKILKSAKFEYDEAWRIITHPTPDVTSYDKDRAQVILDTFKDSLGRIDDANNNLHIR